MAGMEKRTPHYSLDQLKAAVAAAGVDVFTRTALDGAAAMGLSVDEALAVVQGLARNMLFKSMTTFADHTLWQDVYHATCPDGRTAYIKLTLRAGAVVIQFKEK